MEPAAEVSLASRNYRRSGKRRGYFRKKWAANAKSHSESDMASLRNWKELIWIKYRRRNLMKNESKRSAKSELSLTLFHCR